MILSEDHRAIQDAIRDYVQGEITPMPPSGTRSTISRPSS